MNTANHPATTAATLPRSPAALGEALRALRAVAQRLDAWLEARKRAAEDRDTLARMSDRDLHDIGLERGCVHEGYSSAYRLP
jgi:uncharacterized protein YjiS (DUF1127 family)